MLVWTIGYTSTNLDNGRLAAAATCLVISSGISKSRCADYDKTEKISGLWRCRLLFIRGSGFLLESIDRGEDLLQNTEALGNDEYFAPDKKQYKGEKEKVDHPDQFDEFHTMRIPCIKICFSLPEKQYRRVPASA
jgi:hypothetical protein